MEQGSTGNRVAIITGAGSGIGEETSYTLAKQGYSVSLVDMDGHKLKKVQEKMKEMAIPTDKILTIKCDLSEESSYETIINETISKFGQLDVLVNNAGFGLICPLDDLMPAMFDKCYYVMLKAPLFLSQKALPHLKKTKGCIVNLSSIASKNAAPISTAYCAIKAGVKSITKSLALEGAQYGIRVNSVHPGVINTPLLEAAGMSAEAAAQLYDLGASITPLGRTGFPKDVASAIKFLISEDASFVTGAGLFVDGGISLTSASTSVQTTIEDTMK